MRVDPLVGSEDVAWFRDEPQAARGAAAALARRIGLGEQRTAEVALAMAELASNVRKHAPDGAIVLRVVRAADMAGIEVLVMDTGPGIADVDAAMGDGVSGTGTLGIGLGVVNRLADVFQIHSRPGQGTVQLARFWPRAMPEALRRREPGVAGITRAISGEDVCGDAWFARMDPPDPETAPPSSPAALLAPLASAVRPVPVRSPVPGPGPGVLVMVCDGLGHGPLAFLAGQNAVRAFTSSAAGLPDQVMAEIDVALRATRGAVVAVARIEPQEGRLLFCGVGNISTYVLDQGKRTFLPSDPGIVGHRMPHPTTFELPLPARGALVMHSDGLSDRWDPADLPGLGDQSPTVLAARLLHHAGTRRDDAGIVVAKGLW